MSENKQTGGQWLALLRALESLPIEVDGCSVRGLELDVPSGWQRRTTVIALRGPDGRLGEGEDVTYAGDDHDGLQGGAVDLGALRGSWSLGKLFDAIRSRDWFEREPGEAKARKYRRCALETAALELACAQANTTLEQQAAKLHFGPLGALHFCVSLSLDGSDFGRIDEVLERDPGARFKIDFSNGWNADTLERLAAYERDFDGTRFGVVDFKGFYRGTFQGPSPEADMYRRVAEALPDAYLEDPWLGADGWGGAAPEAEAVDLHSSAPIAVALRPYAERITFDAPLASRAWLENLPVLPRTLNIKPSRFGGVRETLRTLAFAADKGLGLYVGGQFELGPGREWLQRLARLACPDAPNDCAPTVYNERELPASLPTSPL